MKTLKQILFTLVAVAGLSLAVSAQGGGRPPKDPKKIEPVPKQTPKPKEDKPKKPGMSYFVALPPESGYSE